MVLPREAILFGTSTAKLIISIPNNLISHIIMYPIHSTYHSDKERKGGRLINKENIRAEHIVPEAAPTVPITASIVSYSRHLIQCQSTSSD